ncbi:MAG: peroxidase family protein [Microbacteriaceae bacterium]
MPDPALPFGIRTVDGSFNNLREGQEHFGAADRPFPRLTEPVWSDADPAVVGGPPNPPGSTDMCAAGTTCYGMSAPGSFVYDSDPRTISNLIVDQTVNNPAAVNAAESTEGSEVRNDGTIFLPNSAPDEGLSAPSNAWFTFFGQFFDHGLDLVNKGGNGTLVVPLQPDDPLYVEGSRTNFLMLSRATRLPGADGVVGTDDDEHNNQTTPWVDQNQTYTSHPSHQVFLREYELVDGAPRDTGRLLDAPTGGLATWGDVKRQAREVLGIQLGGPESDKADYPDVVNVPQVATDPYGNFLPGENGFPVLINEGNVLVEGNPAEPISTDDALRTNHAFLDDIAHGATQDPTDLSGYDNGLLDDHFVTGDGRGNENIGLTAVHHVFHSEHNRVLNHIKDVLGANPELENAFQGEAHTWDALMGQPLPQPEADDWTYEQRLFQAARYATEMQYQHLVFEEFARSVQPQINTVVFNENSYNATIDPAIMAEFAHVVYRFGHSLLTEDIARSGFGTADVPLLDGFLNPRAFDMDGTLTPDQAAGSIINGTTNQVANQIDEHVINTLRNELLGLPLDLATINILRSRDTGTPPLQAARKMFFDASGDPLLEPYTSWADFGLSLKNGNNFGRGGNNASLVNFVAAYGTHPTITTESTIAGKRAAASLLVNGAPAGEEFLSRIGGSDLFETAALISQSHFEPGVPVAYVTNGRNFPDALAGGPAAAVEGGPVLLVEPDGVPRATALELARLKPAKIVVLGGPLAVSEGVASSLRGYTSGAVSRIGGATLFDTAAEISKATFSAGVDVAYVATGHDFPDALAGSAVAARDGAPVLLVEKDRIPSATSAELTRLRPQRIVVLGGPLVVGATVEAQLGGFTSGGVTRLGGQNLYDTASLISEASFPNGADRAFIATGANFPDALAAASVAGLLGAPVVLVPQGDVPARVMDELDRLNVQEITILGGTAALGLHIEEQLAGLAPTTVAAPEDRLAFMNSLAGSEWANVDGAVNTGLDDVDFWVGGLAEALEPFGGMLGATFNFVFEQQLEQLQFADRFYYLFRNQGNQLFAALEANSFADLIQRNSDASLLPANIFAVQDPYFDLEALPSPMPASLVQMANGTYRWDGDEHIEIHGNRTAADSIRGGQGDDALWGHGGDDRIEGGSGNDSIIGGAGDDVITDLFGLDNIKGGLGNDAINGGAGQDLLLSSHGDDFVVGGSDNATTGFLSTGDDVYLGGAGGEIVFGGEDDDWIEGGGGADLLQGDNANQFQNDPNGGNDVVHGGSGNDDMEGEGGDDILVGRPLGVDRHEGALGYDWVTYYGSAIGVDADLKFGVLQRPDVQAVRDRYDLVEALSGGSGNDILRGIGSAVDDASDSDSDRHKMTQETLTLIDGLEPLLRPGPDHEDYALRFMANPLPTDTEGVNNLLVGGSGSDIIEGRGGDDFIDGDAYLRVQLEADGQRFDTAEQLRVAVFNQQVNPGSIDIVREIVIDQEDGVVDTAVYAQSVEDYTITDLGNGYTRIEHTGVNAPAESEGADILRNVEILQFLDGCLVLETMEPCEGFGSVSFDGVIAPPTEGQALTATVNFDSAAVGNPTQIRFNWQVGDGTGAWTPSQTGDNLPDESDGWVDTFVPGDSDTSASLRVVVSFMDDNGQLRSIVSTALPGVLDVTDAPTTSVDPPAPAESP